MRDPKELASALRDYARRHRMMMGQTPESALIEEAAEYIEGAVGQAPEPDSKQPDMKGSNAAPSKPRGRGRRKAQS